MKLRSPLRKRLQAIKHGPLLHSIIRIFLFFNSTCEHSDDTVITMRLFLIHCLFLAVAYHMNECAHVSSSMEHDTSSSSSSSGHGHGHGHIHGHGHGHGMMMFNMMGVADGDGGSSSSSTDSDSSSLSMSDVCGGVLCTHQQGAFCNEGTCQCSIAGNFPNCCPDCTHENGAQCNDNGNCVCLYGGYFPQCCSECSVEDGETCCEPGMNCISAVVGECFCAYGEIPDSNPAECCLQECDNDEACNSDGLCDPALQFGEKCSDGVHSSNACVRQAGIKCHTYDCCGGNSGISCSDKYCLCETPLGWIYSDDDEGVQCVQVGGRPPKKDCLDAPIPFEPAT